MQQLHESIRDLPVPQPIEVRCKSSGQHHEDTNVDCVDPYKSIFTHVIPLEQGELQGENKARGKVEQEQNPMGQQGDPGPGEAVLPDALCPGYHVEPDVAVKNEHSTDESSDKEVNVDPLHVMALNEAE